MWCKIKVILEGEKGVGLRNNRVQYAYTRDPGSILNSVFIARRESINASLGCRLLAVMFSMSHGVGQTLRRRSR